MRGGGGVAAVSVLRSRAMPYPNFGRRGSVGDGDEGPTRSYCCQARCFEMLLGSLPSG